MEKGKSPYKVGFFGLFGQQNWGNECSLQAMIYNIRKHHPGLEIYCVCTYPEDTSARYGIPAIPMVSISPTRNVWWGQNNQFIRLLRKVFYFIPKELLHWIKVYRTLWGSQMLIAPGTGLLTDFHGNIYGRCYEIFKLSIIAKLCRCKVMFVSIGAGPIRHPVSRWFIKSALSMADYRSYRNDSSRQYLEGIGFKAKYDAIYPDLAFSLPRSMMPECNKHDKQKLVIGVGVADSIVGIMDYNGKDKLQKRHETIYKEYIDKICSFVIWLLDNKYTVRILTGDTIYDSMPKEELKNQLKRRGYDYNDGNILDEPITSVENLISQLASTDVVVSPRFHNIILALMLNKPIISLSYHNKFSSLMTELELEEYCQDTKDLNIEKLKELFTKLMKNVESIKQHIKLKTEENRLALERQYLFIFNKMKYR